MKKLAFALFLAFPLTAFAAPAADDGEPAPSRTQRAKKAVVNAAKTARTKATSTISGPLNAIGQRGGPALTKQARHMKAQEKFVQKNSGYSMRKQAAASRKAQLKARSKGASDSQLGDIGARAMDESRTKQREKSTKKAIGRMNRR